MEAVKEKPKHKKKKRENAASDSSKNEDHMVEELLKIALEEEVNLVCDTTELSSDTSEIPSSSIKKEGEEPACLRDEEDTKSVETTQELIQNDCTKNKIDENSFEALLAKNKAEVSKIIAAEKLEDTTKLLTQTIQKEQSTVEIIPYTEAQLSAFYRNGELEILDDFTAQYVEAELKGTAIQKHPLFELLMNYLNVREKLTTNTVELNQLRKEYEDCKENLWTVEKTVKSVTGECQDGVRVTAKHVYDKATFHRTVFQTIVRILANLRKLANEDHVLYSYTADDLKLQIELYIQTVTSNCLTVTQLSRSAPISLSLQNEPPYLKPYLTEIRICISVLFSFQRILIRDVQFLKETREWLGRVVAVLLRLANYQDHLFLLNHILRCPPGISNWATCFVQTPITETSSDSPFANFEINHVITTLALLLTPVQEREQFLESVSQSVEVASDALWVVVDSDGEEDDESGNSLRENDLVSLLNQLRIDEIFRSTLLIDKKNCQDQYDTSKINEHHILRFFAFATVLLKILHKGLRTYQQSRYIQFSKRLSRMIRHVVQYATDQWEIFKKSQLLTDDAMKHRLGVEYDSFFLRATYYLYTSQKMGAWQFLAVIPYHMASKGALWKLFYFLHDCYNSAQSLLIHTPSDDYKSKLWETANRSQFEEMLCNLCDAESYYLLNTFANMALARTDEDMDFIEAATLDLLQVGFVSETTQESCSKSARILLSHITSKYPQLLSNILHIVKDNLEKVGSYSLYLYEELPLSIWMPTEDDMKIISSLLLNNPPTSDGSRLSRMIISRLNWDFATSGKLFLPYEMHCDVAILAAEAASKEQAYLQWAWQTVFRLRLHINDKGISNFSMVGNVEQYNVISRGIREQQPLASFLSILLTSWGHLVPLVCKHGLPQLQFLQTHHKHEAVLFALNLIVPLFLESQELLINDEKFQDILYRLISADRTYINMAKSLVTTQQTVLEQFGNLIENQIVNYAWYGLSSPKLLVRMWINSLISIPFWSRDYGILYVLDTIIRAAFFHSDAYEAAVFIFDDLLKCSTPKENFSAISSLFKWVSQSNQPEQLIESSVSKYNWLAYVTISLEYEEKERKTGLWNEILNQLKNQKGKVNVDAAIKKAAYLLKVSSFTSSNLCIYRWAQQAIDSPLDHPLLPLLWQKFFLLYLTRLPVSGITDKGSVGCKFFEGLINFTFCKRMKRRLQETIQHYSKEVEEENCQDITINKQCLKLFKAYALWLEEPRLLDANLYLPSLPSPYESNLLSLIFQGSETPWLEYIDYDRIKSDQMNSIRLWRCSNFREKSNVNQPLPNAGKAMESDNPVERVLRRLASYDAPKPAPEIKNTAPVIANINFGDKESLFKSLENCFHVLQQFAHDHNLRLSAHKSLDCIYQDLVPQLYQCIITKITKTVPCTNKNAVLCTGAARIVIQTQEARLNAKIDHQINYNRNDYEALLGKVLQAPAQSLCTASVTIQQAIKTLQSQLKCNPATAEMGVELFYHILSLLSEETRSYLPTRTLFALCLERLGQSHIEGYENEMPRLLNKILEEPCLGEYLIPYFTPSDVGTANLLQMYAVISDKICQKCDVNFSLLSKFDIENWLTTKTPKIFQRSEFLNSAIKTLTALGFEPPSELHQIHEIYRKHLLQIFEFQFPEHYGDILIALLKASNGSGDNSCVSVSVWMDILNSIAQPMQLKLNVSMREQLRQYAQHQKMLQHRELLDTATLLSQHFTRERLQYGLYGLYPKCRVYIDVYVLLLGMTGHALIVSALNTHAGSLSDRLCEIIWPYLRDMFAPWIVPYSMQNMRENMASWIQQLSDDRSVLLPWISTDGPHAQKMINMLMECVQFVMHTLPGCNAMLSNIWQWYVVSFAHKAVKDHILNPIYASFVSLPWNNFWPSVADLELMLKVIEQNLPECHKFLAHIFISVPWQTWMCNVNPDVPIQIKMRIHHCLLYLLTKLTSEPYIRTVHMEKMKTLLVQAESFEWNFIEPVVYQQIMDWFILSCDPRILFKSDPLDLDVRVLNFLKVVSGYDKPLTNSSHELLHKRHIFVRSYMKLIAVYTTRHKSSIQSKENELVFIINSQLSHMEAVVKDEEEMQAILEEQLCALNIGGISKIAEKCYTIWIGGRLGDGIIIKCLLNTLPKSVGDNEIVAPLLEAVVSAYFQNRSQSLSEASWEELTEFLVPYPPKLNELEQILCVKGCILSLNILLLQRMSKTKDPIRILNMTLDWLEQIKINESIECKLPLLWSNILTLAYNNCEKDEPAIATFLYKFAQMVLQHAGDKGNSGWSRGLLGAIGLGKQSSLSLKFLCRALSGYILAQLPDMKGEVQVVRQTAGAPAIVGQPGGNTECVKVLLGLDMGRSQGKIKSCAELALKQIQDPNNSLHNARIFLFTILKHLDFVKPYLKDAG